MTSATEVKPAGGLLDPRILYTGSRLFVLVLLCVVLTLASPVFLTGTNALNVLRVASLLVILGIGRDHRHPDGRHRPLHRLGADLLQRHRRRGDQGRRAAPAGPGLPAWW